MVAEPSPTIKSVGLVAVPERNGGRNDFTIILPVTAVAGKITIILVLLADSKVACTLQNGDKELQENVT